MIGRTGRAAILMAILGAASSGCAHARAKAMPEQPPLDVPAPPPRTVEPLEAEAPPPRPEEPPRPATPARPRPPAATTAPRQEPPARSDSPKPEPSRTEPSRAEAPKSDAPKTETRPEPPPEPPKAAEEPRPAAPATTLQTTSPASEGEVERAVRATLVRATSDLNRVDYRGLNADARTQYDTAKRFIQQSDDAIRAKNLVFAKNLADKAAALAAQLAGR
jgi:hypothetical protein